MPIPSAPRSLGPRAAETLYDPIFPASSHKTSSHVD